MSLPNSSNVKLNFLVQLAKRAIERDENKRRRYFELMTDNFEPEQLVFVDESAVDKRVAWRQRGYSRKGTRAVKKTDFKRGDK